MRPRDLSRRSGKVPPLLFAAMVLAGIATTMVGPLLPRLQMRWQIRDASAGLLFAALFLASVATGALVGPAASRFGHRMLVRGGLLLSALGVAMLAVAPWPQGIVAMALVGCGLGMSVPAANLCVGGARAVMLVNFAWSTGAVGGPWLLAAFPNEFLWTLSFAMACTCAAQPELSVNETGTTSGDNPVMSKATVLTAAFVFLYVGVESSLDGWLSSYASRNPGTRHLWAALPSIFWSGILIGRFLAAQALLRLVPRKVLGACLVVALGGTCLLLAVSQPWAILVATALTGLGLAPIFPLAVSSYSEMARAEKSAGLIFSAGGLGGASIPALVGSVSEHAGGLGAALAIPSLLMVLMLGLWSFSSGAAGRVEEGQPVTRSRRA